MSSHNDSKQTKRANKPKPSFSGMAMPDDVSFSMGAVHEPTRRAAAGPTSINFAPMNSVPMPSFQSGPMQTTVNPKMSMAPISTSVSASKAVPTDQFRWNLRQVPTLPQYHPLERTAVLVEHAQPAQVSNRISKVLYERSIEAVYDDDKAKVKCTTSDGVDFRVRLYRGRGKFDHGIIVEVQRRFGATFSFHNDTVAILDAAQGKVPPPPPALGSSSEELPLVSDSEDDYAPPSGASSLAMVSKMLGNTGYDSHYLALQTLSSLTDKNKMGAATARAVSTELLHPDSQVGAKVLALIVDKKEAEDMFNLRVMALTILANAIQAVQGRVDAMVREQIRPVLMKELYAAASNPRAAQMASRCFEYLLREDHDLSELHAALEKARDAGAARHSGLMRQAQACLDKMP